MVVVPDDMIAEMREMPVVEGLRVEGKRIILLLVAG